MIEVRAGRHPHIITRPCHDRAEAEQWARRLLARGVEPVLIDDQPFETTPEAAGGPT